MVITLPESSHRGKRSTSWTLVSAFAHVGALALVTATQALPSATAVPREQTVFLDPPKAAPITARPEPRGVPGAAALPASPSVPVFEAPSIILPTLPMTTGAASVDPSAYELRGGFGATTGSPLDRVVDPNNTFDENSVDRRVEPRAGNPVPRYPPSLSAAGINGSVTVRFVVDSAGTVDRSTVRVIFATHRLFEQSVLEALVRMRFVPAEVGKSKVRQLVELPFHFQISR